MCPPITSSSLCHSLKIPFLIHNRPMCQLPKRFAKTKIILNLKLVFSIAKYHLGTGLNYKIFWKQCFVWRQKQMVKLKLTTTWLDLNPQKVVLETTHTAVSILNHEPKHYAYIWVTHSDVVNIVACFML